MSKKHIRLPYDQLVSVQQQSCWTMDNPTPHTHLTQSHCHPCHCMMNLWLMLPASALSMIWWHQLLLLHTNRQSLNPKVIAWNLQIFPTPLSSSALNRGDPFQISGKASWIQKLESFQEPMINILWPWPASFWQGSTVWPTDRQTSQQ